MPVQQLPNAMAIGATSAAAAAAVGTKATAYLTYLQGEIGPDYLLQLVRDSVTVWEGRAAGLLPIVGNAFVLPATAVQTLIATGAISTGTWAHYVRNANDASKYIATDVGPSGAGLPGVLTGDLAAGGVITLGSRVLNAPVIERVSLSGLSATAITGTSATLSVTVAGDIPAGAQMILQATAAPATGPWLSSTPTAAATGVLSWAATGLTAGVTYYYRAFVYFEPGGLQDTVIYAQTDLSSFVTVSATTELILAIGDSITAGAGAGGTFVSWRAAFQALMSGANRAHNMIGPTTGGLGGGPDPDCAAWGGAAIDASTDSTNNIDGRLTTSDPLTPTIFTAATQPTLIVLFVGWNEMWSSTTSSTAATRWTTLFNRIRSLRPSAKVVVCTLHKPADGSSATDRTSLNNTIKAAATATPTMVACADLDAISFVAGDLNDYVHLAEGGAQKVAQAIYNAYLTLQGGVSGNVSVDAMMAHMSANVVVLNNAPDRGTMKGGVVVVGGDFRSAAPPTWWETTAYTPAGGYSPTYWTAMTSWWQIWDIVGHQANLNVIVACRNLELWWKNQDTGAWALLQRVQAPAGDSFPRAGGSTSGDGVGYVGSDGSYWTKIQPNGFIMHGYGATLDTFDPSKIAGLHVRMQVRKQIENSAIPGDQRSLARYAMQVGLDAYPYGGAPQAPSAPYWPGAMSSRYEEVTNDWAWVYATNVSPAYNIDGGSRAPGGYNSRQFITEAVLRANPPPAS